MNDILMEQLSLYSVCGKSVNTIDPRIVIFEYKISYLHNSRDEKKEKKSGQLKRI